MKKILKLEKYRDASNSEQKYYLRSSVSKIVEILGLKRSEDLRESHIATRLNGYIVGRGSFTEFEKELGEWSLPENSKNTILELVKKKFR